MAGDGSGSGLVADCGCGPASVVRLTADTLPKPPLGTAGAAPKRRSRRRDRGLACGHLQKCQRSVKVVITSEERLQLVQPKEIRVVLAGNFRLNSAPGNLCCHFNLF